MRKLTSMVSDGEGEGALDPSRYLELLRRLLAPTSRIGVITAEGVVSVEEASRGDGEWDEEWDIVNVKDTITAFEVTVLIGRKREQKLTFVFMDNVWHVDDIPEGGNYHSPHSSRRGG